MNAAAPDLVGLVAARICHDLTSPLGAIGNGVELAQMGGAAGEEMELIAQSAASAAARMRLFRLAFGPAERGQAVAPAEIRAALGDPPRAGRVEVDWRAPGALDRAEARLAILLLMCFETAMPYGGAAEVSRDGASWTLRGTAARLRHEPALWDALSGAGAPVAVAPAQVQFPLAAATAARMGRTLSVEVSEGALAVRF